MKICDPKSIQQRTSFVFLMLFLILSSHSIFADDKNCQEKREPHPLTDLERPLAHMLNYRDISVHGISRRKVCHDQLRPVESHETSCLCAMGKYPTDQVKWFKRGCGVWFKENNCAKEDRKLVTFDFNFSHYAKGLTDKKRLKIGYVGHWGSSQESQNNFNKNLKPILENSDLDLEIDNTACNAGDNPFLLRETINSLPEEHKRRVVFKGNQTTSTGMWQPFLSMFVKTNIPITTCYQGIEFSKCEEIENKSCLKQIEDKFDPMRVSCITKNNEVKTLTCNQRNVRSNKTQWTKENGSFIPRIESVKSIEIGIPRSLNIGANLKGLPNDFSSISFSLRDFPPSKINDDEYIKRRVLSEFNKHRTTTWSRENLPEVSIKDVSLDKKRKLSFNDNIPEEFYRIQFDHPALRDIYFTDEQEAIKYFNDYSPLKEIAKQNDNTNHESFFFGKKILPYLTERN